MPPKYSFDRPGHMCFGALQGTAPGNIPAYSNQHDHFFSGDRSVDGEVFCGFKYQCVEFARRWLYERKGLVLPDVNWACHIFELKEVYDAHTGDAVPIELLHNNTTTKPVADSLLIYPSTEDAIVGHVAAITEVGDDYVCVADQNYYFGKWPGNYAHKLSLRHDAATGIWTMTDDKDPNDISTPLGCVVFPNVPNREEGAAQLVLHPSLHFKTPEEPSMLRKTFVPTESKANWLDMNNQAERLFVEEFGMDVSRSRLAEAEANYYEMNMELHLKTVSYAVQLHRIFMDATAQVIGDDAQLEVFGIPKEFWPRMRHSWEHQQTYISGRFDFAFNNVTKALKCFEYNADSASTLLECSRIQQKWAESVGLDKTDTRGAGLFMERNLRTAWELCGATGRVHFCVDDDKEEMYTAVACMEGAIAVGLEGKLCVMFDEFHFDENGRVVDSDNVPVTTIWKTWMWETAISDYYAAKEERGEGWKASPKDKVRLCDLLLGDDWDILVFEPMWKLIPSNKAILPIIYHNHPDHPAILKAEYTLTDELRKSGYAKKPIVGRVGRNVTITTADGNVSAESQGNFGERDMIYQELFPLEEQDGYYAILGGWMLGDTFSGTGIREDKTIITGLESPFSAVRIRLNVAPGPLANMEASTMAEDE